MSLPRPDIKFKNFVRYNQIAAILIRHGFGELVSRLNMITPMKHALKRIPARSKHLSTPIRVRMALEELGPSFIKFGQVLSTRPFLLPYEYIAELSRLQDEVEPMPWPLTESILRRELKGEISEIFASVEQVPIASASLAQVHRAVLPDGTVVVIKIQREGIRRIIEADIRIFREIAELLESNVPESRRFNPPGLVEEFARTTMKELNFLNEARNMEIFARNFRNEKGIKIPKLYRKYCTSRILTMELVQGIKISRIGELKRSAIDTAQVCRNGARLVLKMIFEDGFFHADPHPGNLFVLDNGVIAPVDYGMMGILSESQMDELGDLVAAIVSRDSAAIVRVLRNIGVIEDAADLKRLEQDISELIIRYYRVSLGDINVRNLMEELYAFVQQHRIRFQTEFMLLGKSLVTYEELARLLNPEFDLISEMSPYMRNLTARKYNPRRFIRDFQALADELRWLLTQSPQEMRQVLQRLRRGELQLQMRVQNLDSFIRELDRSSNRLSLSLLVAALIVGSSIIATMQKGYTVFDIPLLGLIGYLFAAVLGIFLVISILRSRKI